MVSLKSQLSGRNTVCGLALESFFYIFPVHGTIDKTWHHMGPGGFFPTNPDLTNILGRTDLDFENLYFFHFLDPRLMDFQVPKIIMDPHKIVLTGGLPAPQTSWRGACSPPCPPAFREAPPLGLSVDFGTKILVPRSWYQDLGTKVLVPRS